MPKADFIEFYSYYKDRKIFQASEAFGHFIKR